MSSSSAKKRQFGDFLDEPSAAQERKKPRPLPLRTNFIPRHQVHCQVEVPVIAVQPNPSTLTPVESSEDDSEAGDFIRAGTHTLSGHANGADNTKLQQSLDGDQDLEMVDFQPESAGLFPPRSARSTGTHSSGVSMSSPIPSQLINQALSMGGGRTATPIYSHFTSNMNVDVMMRDNNNYSAMQSPLHHVDNPPDANPICRELWHNRRLPSPVSEGEKSPDPLRTSEQKSLQNSAESLPDADVENSKFTMDAPEVGYEPQDIGRQRHPASNAKPPSQADTHSNTRNQTNRMKMGIAMGFRADCDKCQRRVPGHYSHIIRS